MVFTDMGCYIWGVKQMKTSQAIMTRSIEQIKNDYPKVGDLRKEAARLKRENNLNDPLIRNGKEIQISTGRRDELIDYISRLEQLAAKPQTREEITTPQTVETVETREEITTPQTVEKQIIDKDSDYTESEQEKLFIAQKLYKSTEKNDDLIGLKEYRLRLEKSGKYYLPEFAILVARTRVIIEGYADSKSPNGKASPGGLQAIRVEIMKYLKEICESEKDKFGTVNDTTLMDTFTEFEDAVRGAFKDISKIKYRLYKEKRDSGERDVRQIKAANFVNWAKDIVSNLPDNSARWKEVSIAVMLLTGRRQSEVMSSGIFTYIDDSHLRFEGQLKRHTDQVVESAEIPVIGGMAQHIINAIKWLEQGDKRTLPTERTSKAISEAAKQSHNRCSRYISETMHKLEDKVEITNGKTWQDKKGNNVFKAHFCRQLYAQICAEIFAPNDQKKQSFIGDILLESREAAPSYDRDIEVIDIDKIK